MIIIWIKKVAREFQSNNPNFEEKPVGNFGPAMITSFEAPFVKREIEFTFEIVSLGLQNTADYRNLSWMIEALKPITDHAFCNLGLEELKL